MARQRVAILAGGYSSEWEISMLSASVVLQHLPAEIYETYIVRIKTEGWHVIDGETAYDLDLTIFGFFREGKEIRFDVAFNAIHGNPGENGLLQGYLESRGIIHTTCSQSVSALTFNKWQCNTILKQFGFTCAKSILLQKDDEIKVDHVISELSLPLFVKPNKAGSSFGVSKVKDKEMLIPAIEKAWLEDKEVLIEAFMDGTEVACGAFQHKGKIHVFSPTEIRSENEFFDYEAKYQGKALEITPAEISDDLKQKVQDITNKVYKRIDAKGLIRVDFILIEKVPYIIEVNTIPGLSNESIVPQQVRHAGMELGHFFHLLIQEASL